MKNILTTISILSLLFLWNSTSYSQKRQLTLKEITDIRSDALTIPLPNIARWSDAEHYIESKQGSPAVSVDVRTGTKTPYKYLAPKPVGKAIKAENQLYSPDSSWIAYTINNNLYAQETATGRTVQYTTDGSATILNGIASWVYYEEILNHVKQTFWWSPDSKYLAFFRTDESLVPTFPVFNIEGQHGSLSMTRYPKAGDPNPQVQVGIVGVEGGPITWADFNFNEDQYFGKPYWTPDSKAFWIQWMPRKQNQLKIYAIEPSTGKKSEVYTETQSTWVDWKTDLSFLKKQPSYLIQNTTDGWDQIYLYGMDGRLKNQLTKGKNFWNTQILHIDEGQKTVYFTSFAEKSSQCDLYSVKLDGSSLKRLTFGDFNHQIVLSPTGKYFITKYSNLQTPTKMALVESKSGKIIRELGDSKSPTFDSIQVACPEIVEYTTSDGLKVPAIIFMPTNFDPTKKYPVVIYTYGGPNAGRVVNRWWGTGSWYSYEGVIRVILDHRGSGHCGQKGLDYLYRRLGQYEIADFTDFVKQQLYTKPYIDRTKIGIEGHSYGGYLTALAVTKASEYFKYGIADAGVMDWMLYDSHYTERYMDTPQNNPEGYKNGAVLSYVNKYNSDNLLYIRHGLIDDNVHPQNSFQLALLLEQAKKPFQMMIYPECTHNFISRSLNTTYNDAITFWYRQLLNKEPSTEILR